MKLARSLCRLRAGNAYPTALAEEDSDKGWGVGGWQPFPVSKPPEALSLESRNNITA